jgi:hypothetical protein
MILLFDCMAHADDVVADACNKTSATFWFRTCTQFHSMCVQCDSSTAQCEASSNTCLYAFITLACEKRNSSLFLVANDNHLRAHVQVSWDTFSTCTRSSVVNAPHKATSWAHGCYLVRNGVNTPLSLHACHWPLTQFIGATSRPSIQGNFAPPPPLSPSCSL